MKLLNYSRRRHCPMSVYFLRLGGPCQIRIHGIGLLMYFLSHKTFFITQFFIHKLLFFLILQEPFPPYEHPLRGAVSARQRRHQSRRCLATRCVSAPTRPSRVTRTLLWDGQLRGLLNPDEFPPWPRLEYIFVIFRLRKSEHQCTKRNFLNPILEEKCFCLFFPNSLQGSDRISQTAS